MIVNATHYYIEKIPLVSDGIREIVCPETIHVHFTQHFIDEGTLYMQLFYNITLTQFAYDTTTNLPYCQRNTIVV